MDVARCRGKFFDSFSPGWRSSDWKRDSPEGAKQKYPRSSITGLTASLLSRDLS
jgi:hypothetical protein